MKVILLFIIVFIVGYVLYLVAFFSFAAYLFRKHKESPEAYIITRKKVKSI